MKEKLSFYLSSFLTGLGLAFIVPLMGLFLVQEIGASPMYMGMFLGTMSFSGVVISHFLSQRSDKGMDRKKLLYLAQASLIVGTLVFAFNRNYWVALFSAIIFIGLSNLALPQLFAMGRQYADFSLGKGGNQFFTLIRAQISLAWIVGPPTAFIVADLFGFSYAFLATASMAGICLLIIRAWMPQITIPPKAQSKSSNGRWYDDLNVVFLLICVLLFGTANGVYIVAMPLYVVEEMKLESHWAGYLMGVAAAIEIPVMLAGNRLAERIGKKNTVAIAVVCGILFYIGIYYAETVWHLMALQVLNGLFWGIFSSLPILMFQDLMPSRVGLASSLFVNCMNLASLMAGWGVGMVAEFANYHSALVVCLLVSVLGTSLMFFVKNDRQPEPLMPSLRHCEQESTT